MKHLKAIINKLTESDMAFWLLPPLMLLLVAGTIAQRWIGLWPAMEKFFASFIIWAGPIPLPGAYILLGLLSINLTLKFLLKSDWKKEKSGINFAHLGALILLIGGLITSISASEYFMIIPEGHETPYIYSYTDRSITIYEDEKEIIRRAFKTVKAWEFRELPFSMVVQSWCKNCNIIQREHAPDYDKNQSYQSMARFMSLQTKPEDPQPEINLTGIEFEISGTDQDGKFIAFDGMPEPIEISHADKTYKIIFGKDQRKLPFSIALTDFVKEQYSGIETARSYHSDIVINDNATQWPTRIEMNKPLRYAGYTFFQSSFEQGPDFETTILAVVQNKGWLFPYIGSLVIGAGLLLHILIKLMRKETS